MNRPTTAPTATGIVVEAVIGDPAPESVSELAGDIGEDARPEQGAQENHADIEDLANAREKAA
ncbi:MAG: hypothetical protein OEO77_06410, partial [Acidimicrobiia bacterium]|nr:hypothetical protein [Acidimicrobiia bacterium]